MGTFGARGVTVSMAYARSIGVLVEVFYSSWLPFLGISFESVHLLFISLIFVPFVRSFSPPLYPPDVHVPYGAVLTFCIGGAPTAGTVGIGDPSFE